MPATPFRHWHRAPALLAAALLLGGCAATQVAIEKRNLDVQTRMSATIFLDPVPVEEQTVFVQIRNTSDKPELDLAPEVAAAMQAKGYRVVTDPRQAKFYLQANVLAVGKSDPSAIRQVVGGGFGAGVSGGASGIVAATAAAGALGPTGRAVATGAATGGFGEVVIGSLVKDVYFSIVTDVQIKERLPEGRVATQNSALNNRQGTSGGDTVSYTDRVDMKTYQTRIVSTANKVNLEFEEAVPALRAGLVRALTGLF
ncbi:conjugal transfer protein TraT [beta proteobacterium AAP121]|nr:conjugal transfer protein TraT [beta proteobacterium AAP65]KPF99121.1 conjugal transfer protein TraT [beta proteobacterium AAP121]